ncbi:MAG: DUF2721 domain-containing protein [Candidatus Omnitrophota bacterium]
MTNSQLVTILQSSVAPCVLISGAGLLLLALANRLPRPIDRARHLCSQVKNNPGPQSDVYRKQIKIYYRRSLLLRNAIACNVMSLGAIASVILLLFLSSLFNLSLIVWVNLCFITGLFSLISSLLFFLSDISLTLKSLEIDIKEAGIVL